jgi:hypothetical protein
MALVWALFGNRCDYYQNLYKIYTVMDMQEVQQLKGKFTPENCYRISWAILDNGRAFFNMVLTPKDFESGLLAFPQSFLSSILESVRLCNPIQWGNFPSDWLQQPKCDPIDTDAAKHKLRERWGVLQEQVGIRATG